MYVKASITLNLNLTQDKVEVAAQSVLIPVFTMGGFYASNTMKTIILLLVFFWYSCSSGPLHLLSLCRFVTKRLDYGFHSDMTHRTLKLLMKAVMFALIHLIMNFQDKCRTRKNMLRHNPHSSSTQTNTQQRSFDRLFHGVFLHMISNSHNNVVFSNATPLKGVDHLKSSMTTTKKQKLSRRKCMMKVTTRNWNEFSLASNQILTSLINIHGVGDACFTLRPRDGLNASVVGCRKQNKRK
ncbi:CLUMA_CG010188, isoform A [Clunio marinus]|uniref:CLUMA_CG010188, isoform A n=1 Tax=Clunio marinus TaxID=568069 RepID=A0A1J1IDI7_9DIPT|nr:CLUMA_CG010188, isoform A [Clunio marinus]